MDNEKDFDYAVRHTLRIELTDGSFLIYEILPRAKRELMATMRSLAFGDPDVKPATAMCFDAFPNRTVFINIRYLLNLIFCFDSPTIMGPARYQDNFDVMPEEPKLEEGETIADLIPAVLLKLAYPMSLKQSQILSFDVPPGELAGLDMEAWEPQEQGARQFIALDDEDGEPNFINLEYVMCLEASHEVVNEEDFDENQDEEP